MASPGAARCARGRRTARSTGSTPSSRRSSTPRGGREVHLDPHRHHPDQAPAGRGRGGAPAGRGRRTLPARGDRPAAVAHRLRGRPGPLPFRQRPLCERSGGERDSLLGRRLDELQTLDLPEFDAGRVAAVLRGEPQRFEVEERHGGAPSDREVQLVPDRDADGRVIGFLFVSADVTERRRADRELQRVLAMLRGVLDAATQVSIIAADPGVWSPCSTAAPSACSATTPTT
ncbi:PAS domain S-box protein [Piscinibacter aquaticus]|uniref:PAS domain S-box protein n=1 Tax=Piscinibacter aquaticus TaxID=392597 RepID=A0A5C6TYU0_9BURK|nr:PAS domain S-box protein [Piscinibacter aquaticus]